MAWTRGRFSLAVAVVVFAAAAPFTALLAAQPGQLPPSREPAPPAAQTGGFDGAKAFAQVAKLVSFGPHPPGTPAIRNAQDYIRTQLKGFGCPVDTDDFHAETPNGTVEMQNIVAKIPGTGTGIIVLLTHYDTLRLDNFVGADDGGSSSGLMLEMARLLCKAPKQPNAVWIAFLDGEESEVVVDGQAQWNGTDEEYGSRELAARMAVSGDLKRTRAAILADMVGQYDLKLQQEENSTRWLSGLVWRNAERLGYGKIFVGGETGGISDDHEPFLHRGVPAVDIIELSGYPYWHTTQDTLDKVSPRSLAIVGHVILASLTDLQERK